MLNKNEKNKNRVTLEATKLQQQGKKYFGNPKTPFAKGNCIGQREKQQTF